MLEQALREVLNDLPWVDNVRLVVGPLASRESVKDLALAQTSVLPSWAIGTLHDLAVEILKKSTVSVDKSLSLLSQCDALERVAATDFVRNAIPELAVHLKSRSVAMKIAKFLTHVDRYCLHQHDLEAIVEYFQEKDPNVGALIRVVAQLWSEGQLQPWGEGDVYRKAIELEAGQGLPKKIWLWGFHEFVPAEEAFVQWLLRQGVEVRLIAPARAVEWFKPRCEALAVQLDLSAEAGEVSHVWEPHSVWDELEFLREELTRLRDEGVRWNEIAVFVPADDVYKRLVRGAFHEWNVPVLDPTLSGAWKDKPRWLWWRDLLRTVASGLKAGDVRAWLGPGAGRRELFDEAFARGVHGNARQWTRLLEKHDLPELRLLVEAVPIFGRAMSPGAFLEACERLVPRAEQLIGTGIESTLLLEFARHLCDERPYLETFKGRLHRYVALFEEFLEIRSRAESLRATGGIRFVAHGVWLPSRVRHAFVLGANLLSRNRPSADAWDWEAVEVQRIWDKLHFTSAWVERARRDETLLLHGFLSHDQITVSAIEYGLGGEPLPKGALYQKLKESREPERSGGSPNVGWITAGGAAASPGEANEVKRPDLAPAASQGKPMRVSAFEDYLRCPFIYFARHVLQLSEENELGLDPDGRARGNILHKVLERYLGEEIKSGVIRSGEEAKMRIRALVDEEIREQPLSGMFRHKPLIEKARSNLAQAAERWIDWELENRKKHPDVKPYEVEMSVEFDVVPGFRVRGKADRIDSDGKHSVVIDYKSGGAPLIGKELAAGIGAQLLMYAHGVQASRGLEPGAAFYLTLGRKIDGKNGIFLKKHQKKLHSAHPRNSGVFDGDFETLFEKVSANWSNAARRLLEGDFTPRPARGRKDCDACSFKNVCGHELEGDGGGGSE